MAIIFLDVNIVVSAAGHLGDFVQTVDDFAYAIPGKHKEIEIVKNFALSALEDESEFTLVTSQVALNTMQKKLIAPSVNEDGTTQFAPLSKEDAIHSTAVFAALVQATGGYYVNTEAVRKHESRAQALIPAHKQGRAKGQIDHEDITIIAGILAALELEDADTNAVLVTEDRGLINCASELARVGIAVVNAARYVRATVAA